MIVTAMFGALLGAGVFVALPRTRATTVAAATEMITAPVPRASRRTDRDARETVEAVACWTEQIRDTISASGGLVQAVTATAQVCPEALEAQVRRLVADLAYLDPAVALRRFADAVDHPTCDLVVSALVAAQRHPVRDLAHLLGHLAECAREESRAHLRIWVGRARTRRAVRIITGVVAGFVAGLLVMSPGYLSPFATAEGLVAAALVAMMFVAAFWRLALLARIPASPRLIGSATAADL